MFSLLNKPYPATEPGKRSILFSIGVGIFVGAFLAIFQPFGTSEIEFDFKILKLLSFGIISGLVVVLFYHFIPLLGLEIMRDKHWTVWKELLYFLCMIVFLAVFNNLYSSYLRGTPFTWSDLLGMVSSTFMIAVVPGFFMVLLDYNHKLKKYVEEVQGFNFKQLEQKRIHNAVDVVQIPTDNLNDQIPMNPADFLFAEAEGNYLNVSYLKNDILHKKLFRITLKKFENQLTFENLIKCHRSFIVNLQHVENAKGNAQGYKLKMMGTDDIVPVSRKYVPFVKQYFASNN